MFKFLNQVYKEIIKEFFGEVDKIVVLGNFYFNSKCNIFILSLCILLFEMLFYICFDIILILFLIFNFLCFIIFEI